MFKVLNDFDSRIVVERASVDEAYLDLTSMVDQVMSNSHSEPIDLSLDRFPTTHIANGKDTEADYVRENSLKQWLDNQCSKDLAAVRIFSCVPFSIKLNSRYKNVRLQVKIALFDKISHLIENGIF